jgi:hypothetical protein
MSFLINRRLKRDQVATPVVQQPQQQEQPTFTPPADGNYIGLMKDMLGPTPAEREAQERKIAENKAKMSGWLGLFQGLGALGDLYYASKGVNPSKPDNTPQAIIEKNAADEKQRLDNLYRNRQAYANMLYNLQRQAGEDARKDKLADAQAKWYDTRDEMARDKAELEKLKAVRVIKQKDGSLMKFDPVLGTVEPLKEADPLYVEYMNSRINATNKRAGLMGAPVTTTTTNEKGETKTSVKTYGRGGSTRGEKKKTSSGNKKPTTTSKISTGVKWKTKAK